MTLKLQGESDPAAPGLALRKSIYIATCTFALKRTVDYYLSSGI